MTVSHFYLESVKPLPVADRLRLATLILEDIPPRAVVDFSEEWSDEDLKDFTASTWAGAPWGKEDDDAA